MTLRLQYSVRSHVGKVRQGNEDSAYAGSRLAIVADGMGGHAAGEIASSAVVATLAQLDEDEAGLDLLEVLAAAVHSANDHLRAMVDANPALEGMGTTLTAMLSSGTRLGIAHVGDSRGYLLRDDEFTQLTHDQTLVQRLVDEGRITLEQAESHPQRSLLTQALDGRSGVEPDLSVREARRGDRYLLSSDGLSGYVAHETIGETLKIEDAEVAADRLIDLALEAGAPDNVTVVIADVVEDSAGLPDTPVVGGAAAEQDAVPSAIPAVVPPGGASVPVQEQAANLGESSESLQQTPPAGMPPISDEPPPYAGPRRRWYRRFVPLALAGVILAVTAGILITWAIVASSWYVANAGDRVALFHGIKSAPLGLSLSRVEQRGAPLRQLDQVEQDQVRAGIVADNRADGVCILARLASDATTASTPTPSTSFSPTPSTSPAPKSCSP